VSHPFVEWLIGPIRREFLDHVPIWNAVDLGRKLEEFRNYYNENRVTSRSVAALRENDLANRRQPMRSLITTLGGTIAAVFSRCRSQRNLRFRHGQVSRIVPHHLREFVAQGQAQLKFQIIAHNCSGPASGRVPQHCREFLRRVITSHVVSRLGTLSHLSPENTFHYRFYRGGRQIQGPEELWRRTWAKTLLSLP
jgi:hypothetical protein